MTVQDSCLRLAGKLYFIFNELHEYISGTIMRLSNPICTRITLSVPKGAECFISDVSSVAHDCTSSLSDT